MPTVATVSNNSVFIRGGEVHSVYGGFSNGSTTNNSVFISGGKVVDFIKGGDSMLGAATHNRVFISGGEVGADIYGGLSFRSDATYNSVTISGKPVLTNARLYGGRDNDISTPNDVFTGNTLNLWGFKGTVEGVISFQYMNFALPGDIKNGETMLNVSNIFHLGETAAALRRSVFSVGIMGGGRVQQAGEKFTLVKAQGMYSPAFGTNASTAQGIKGISLLYNFDITVPVLSTRVIATINGAPKLNPQTKALSEARAASSAFANQGADLVAGQGMQSALWATSPARLQRVATAQDQPPAQENAPPAGGFYSDSGPQQGGGLRQEGDLRLAAFASTSASTSRYDTGSHLDVDGVSLITGLAARNHVGIGNLLLGVFFEGGWGSFDSHNGFSSRPDVSADGNSNYYGGGLLGRYDFNCGFYADASARLGRLKTEFSSDDLQNFMGQGSSYDSSVMYYGAHAGLGYIWALTEAASLDLYTKYLWTHQDSDDVTISGDQFKFNAIDSHRWRGGTRFSYSFDGVATPYVGAAYEHEFDGKANASVYGYSMDAPTLEGGTSIGEVGITLTPADTGFSLDIGMQGYAGMREGVSGNMQLKYEF